MKDNFTGLLVKGAIYCLLMAIMLLAYILFRALIFAESNISWEPVTALAVLSIAFSNLLRILQADQLGR